MEGPKEGEKKRKKNKGKDRNTNLSVKVAERSDGRIISNNYDKCFWNIWTLDEQTEDSVKCIKFHQDITIGTEYLDE